MARRSFAWLGSMLVIASAVSACGTGNEPSGSIGSPGSAEGAVPAGTHTSTQIPPEFRTVRPEDLNGKTVYDADGQRIGTIDNVVVNRGTLVTAMVVDTGGMQGTGETKAVIPVDEIRMQGDRIVAMDVTSSSTGMEAYREGDWYRYERNRTLGELTR